MINTGFNTFIWQKDADSKLNVVRWTLHLRNRCRLFSSQVEPYPIYDHAFGMEGVGPSCLDRALSRHALSGKEARVPLP